MAQFFLFAEDRDTLERRVNDALVGYRQIGGQKALPYTDFDGVLQYFDPAAGAPWRGGTSNPFTLTDYKTKQQLFPPAEGDIGWGAPLAGEAADVGELAAVIRSANPAEDPLIRSTLGGEFGARIFVDAPNWQNWTTGTGRGRNFGTRGQARSLIRADALATRALTGKGVGVFVVDRGISQRYVESLGGDYGGGFVWDPGTGPVLPGQADAPFQKTRREHGALMVRSILDLAPEATIWDLPLLPPQIKDVTGFALVASFAYFALWVVTSPDFPHLRQPWVIANAWGIDDRFGEAIWGDYTTSPHHPLNVWIGKLGRRRDVVFAAGNSGQFRPDPDAGPYDRGPGRSIFGGNADSDVTSVGAIRGDAIWIGTSSQGPGPSSLGNGADVNEKPDLCAPCWFSEPSDRALRNTGTSTACAVTAGVVAALRSPGGGFPDISPTTLRGVLRQTARRDWHTEWNGRMGAGILCVSSALDGLGNIADV